MYFSEGHNFQKHGAYSGLKSVTDHRQLGDAFV